MICLAATKVGILQEDTNDMSMLSHDNAACSNNRYTGDLMVVDAVNVDGA
jgi:hypothetical protein